MNIVVCIKQVPDVDDIKWTKENNLDRSQMLSKMNPQDEWAICYALKIKEIFKNVKVTALSMGPLQAKAVLNEALAMGVDRAILLSDKQFQGSDTLATAKIISTAVKKYIPDFDLILTGQMAIDGDTAQTPLGIAKLLNIGDVENVIEIKNADKKQVLVIQKIDDTENLVELRTPCLVAIKEQSSYTVDVKIDDYIRAQNVLIETYNAQDLEIEKTDIGVLGSPTMVYRAYKNETVKEAKEIKENSSKTLMDMILKVQK